MTDFPTRSGDSSAAMTRLATALMWLVPAVMVVPNIWLDITECQYSVADKVANLLLPAGLWLTACAASRRVGVSTLLLFPVMVLCAFQIVVLVLYGDSIIGIDMFMNVSTTNVTEANEILVRLWKALLLVCVLYLIPVGLAVTLLAKGGRVPRPRRRRALIAAAVLCATGLGAMCPALFAGDAGPDRRIFPLNAVCNLCRAVERTRKVSRHDELAAGYSFGARDTRPADAPEIYVMVIGETSRAADWQLNGYERPTNPRLSATDGVVWFPRALSESNVTHKSVPLMTSLCEASDFEQRVYSSRSIVSAFREAGYATAWLSAQKRNHSLIDDFAGEADLTLFLTDDGATHSDMELLEALRNFLRANGSRKCFVVLHTYGSHFDYSERVPASMRYFTPRNPALVAADNRADLRLAYDNTIRYTDHVLASLASLLDSCRVPAAMLYASDHGEDIFDDSRARFTHASPRPTSWQLHVPMLVWLSGSYRSAYPGVLPVLRANARADVSTSRSAPHTLFSLAGLSSPRHSAAASLADSAYKAPRKVYLNDYNDCVALGRSGLADIDMLNLRRAGFILP